MAEAATSFARLRPFQPFTPAKWHGLQAPPYDWMVDGCFLRGTVAMLSGDGGLGKSLIVQQLLTAAAIGRPWLGLATQRCRVFGFFCEDDEDELHRRQEAICEHYECAPGDLSDVEYVSRVGMENVLAEFDRRTEHLNATPLFDQLRNAVKSFGAQILVLDTVADVFAGDEIRRNQVRRFVSLLRGLAVEIQGVVILNAHPSLTGINSGSGLSGSTAWNNSVRSRLYLTRASNEQEQEDTNARFLKTMKNNQGPFGGKIKLQWRDGVFARDDGETDKSIPSLSMEERGWLNDIVGLLAEPNQARFIPPMLDMRPVWCVTRDQLRDWLRKFGRLSGQAGQALQSTDRSRFHRYLSRLRDKNLIGLSDDLVWRIGDGQP